jgi:1,4-alpha-glucan branching enzyme
VLLESVDNQTSLLRCGTERIRVAQLNFDFQRAGHVLLTGEGHREYADYSRPEQELGRCLDEGFAFQGRRSSYHRRVRGEPGAPPTSWTQIVNFLQNHDTSGNRYLGQRLDELVRSPGALRAATALLLLHPGIPFLFMGQEWGAGTPFHFFTDFPEELGRITQQGRLALFWEVDPATCPERAPGCQEPEAFARSALRWGELDEPRHREHLEFVRRLLEVRRRVLPQMSLEVQQTGVERQGRRFTVRIGPRQQNEPGWLLVANLSDEAFDPGPTSELVYRSGGGDEGPAVVPPKTTRLYRL